MAVEEGVDEYTKDGTVDLKGNPVRRSKRGGWTACSFIVGMYSLSLFLPPLHPLYYKDANRNAQRPTVFGRHMESTFKGEEAPLPHSCPQGPLPRHLHTLLIPNLLYPTHQNPNPPILPSGLWVKFTLFFPLSGWPISLSDCLCEIHFVLFLFNFLQLDDSVFINIEIGQRLVIDDPDGDFSVTAFDANHCPGVWLFFGLCSMSKSR